MYVLQNSAVAASAGAALVLFFTGIGQGTHFWPLVRYAAGDMMLSAMLGRLTQK